MSVRVASGVICALVLASGVIVSVLTYELLKNLLITLTDQSGGTYSLPFWALGLAYVVPGLLGVIGSATNNKCVYITTMVFSIITLLVMAIFFILAILALGSLAVLHPGPCDPSIEGGCAGVNKLYAMAISSLVFLIFGWVMTLVGTILSGIMACGRKDHQPTFVMQQMPATQMGRY